MVDEGRGFANEGTRMIAEGTRVAAEGNFMAEEGKRMIEEGTSMTGALHLALAEMAKKLADEEKRNCNRLELLKSMALNI